MIWISEFFFCVGTMSLVGSIAFIIFLVFRKVMERSRRGLIPNVIKTIIALYLIPFVYIILRMAKIEFRNGTWMNIGDFGASMSPVFVSVFNIIALVWFAGLITGVMVRAVQYLRLRNALRVNIPVEDDRWEEMVRAECEKYHLKHVRVFQNEEFSSPFVTGAFRPMIIIPLAIFPEKNMRMMVEHEVGHIRSHHLIWKMVVLWASWLHWFNPLVYLLMEISKIEQEIECDMLVCENNQCFDEKEYMDFLMSFEEVKRKFIFSTTLFESKKDVIRRMEAMSARRKLGKANKVMLLVCSLVLVFVSAVPTYAMADAVASAEEKVLYNTEAMNDNVAGNDAVEYTLNEEPLKEVVIDIDTYASMITIDFTAEPYTRYYFKSQSMEVGDQISVNIQCSDSDALYWVGIKEIYTNTGRYVYGTGAIAHVFTITEEGTYRVFLENRSDNPVDFLGAAIYPN